MSTAEASKPFPTIPLVLAVLLLGGLALVLESRLSLPIRLPGHRALPGAMALVLLAGRAPRRVLLGFAAAVGVVIALVSANPGDRQHEGGWLAAGSWPGGLEGCRELT